MGQQGANATKPAPAGTTTEPDYDAQPHHDQPPSAAAVLAAQHDEMACSRFVVAFFQQLPALVGVIVGAVATIFVTSLSDRTRWRRSQAVRWDQERLKACAQYAETIKHLQLLSTRMSAAARPGSRSLPLDRNAGEELIAQGEVARAKAWESVLLLGDADTVSAGRVWRDAVLRLEFVARGLVEEATSWSELDGHADRARERFYAAARQSLGVTGGPVPPSRLGRAQAAFGDRAHKPPAPRDGPVPHRDAPR